MAIDLVYAKMHSDNGQPITCSPTSCHALTQGMHRLPPPLVSCYCFLRVCILQELLWLRRNPAPQAHLPTITPITSQWQLPDTQREIQRHKVDR